MLELGGKERNILSGLFVQILIVALLVFVYTQAVRQIQHQRELLHMFEEQLTLARETLAEVGAEPDLTALQERMARQAARFPSRSAVEENLDRLQDLARETYRIRDPSVEFSKMPVRTFTLTDEGRPNLEIALYAVEVEGSAGSREAARFLAALSAARFVPLCAMTSAEFQAAESVSRRPVHFRARWLVPVLSETGRERLLTLLPQAHRPTVGSVFAGPGPEFEGPAWGDRTEPFRSPFLHPQAIRAASAGTALSLTEIGWEANHPVCRINGRTLRPGEEIEGFRLLLVTSRAVLLEKDGKEHFLALER